MLAEPLLAEPPPPVHDPEEVRRLADEILGRGEFQPPDRSLLERVIDWIADRLPSFDGASVTTGGGGSGVLTLVLLALLIAGLGLAVRALLRQPRRHRSDVELEPEAEVEAHRTAREWSAAAARHEAAGEWKDGLRCRFRALTERLAGEGVVPDTPGRTSGEYRLDVASTLPEVSGDFEHAALLFDRAWYGDFDTGPEEAEEFAEHADRVLASVGDGR